MRSAGTPCGTVTKISCPKSESRDPVLNGMSDPPPAGLRIEFSIAIHVQPCSTHSWELSPMVARPAADCNISDRRPKCNAALSNCQ